MLYTDLAPIPVHEVNVPEQLVESIAELQPPTIIAVSGFGGSGKSSFATALGRRINAPIIGVDAFIIDRTMSQYTRWGFIDFDRLEQEVLRPFVEGKSITYGQFDWAINAIGQRLEVPPASQLIVEGVGLFRPGLLRYFSLLVWVDCPLEEAIRRGKQRDRVEYNNPQDHVWDGIWRENDVECFNEYCPKEIAHFVINNDDDTSNSITLP